MRPRAFSGSLALGALLASVLVSACAKEPTAVNRNHDASLQVFLSLNSSAIASVVVTVTAPDIADTLAFNLTIQNGTASGTIVVPTGSNRTVTVRAYDAGGIETYRGQKTINVLEGTNPTVTITLLPLTGNQPIVVTIGSYILTVSPAVDTLKAGDTVRLHAVVMTASGDTAVPIQWATLNPGRATVDTSGLVTAGSPGAVQIVATFGGVGGAAALQVIAANANYGLRFNGHDVVIIPDAPALNPTSALTLEFWVEFDSVDAGQYGVLKDNGTSRMGRPQFPSGCGCTSLKRMTGASYGSTSTASWMAARPSTRP